MKPSTSLLPLFSLLIGIQFPFGGSELYAQSSGNQTTGGEFGYLDPQSLSDPQNALLWKAYNTKSDSLLGKFFNNWRLETQIVEEPDLETPIANATASLYYYLLDTDLQTTNYQFKYALIQDEVVVTAPETDSDLPDEYVLKNYHPQASDPYHPILILLDQSHVQMLSDFLGNWSEAKAKAAQNFFGNFVPIGLDVNHYEDGDDWALVEHWYSFAFSADLLEANVVDETPSGSLKYTCIIGSDGNWMKVPNDVVIVNPPVITEPPIPIEPGPEPTPLPWPHPRPPHPPVPPPINPTITPAPAPPSNPKPPERPRPISPPVHNPNPQNPTPIERPRPVTPPEHNPALPEGPINTKPATPAVREPAFIDPPVEQLEQPRQNPPQVYTPPPSQPEPAPQRSVNSREQNTTVSQPSRPPTPAPAPPSERNTQDTKKKKD